MDEVVLSIVIITLDRFKELFNCIYSCLEKLSTEKEIIIIDNGIKTETEALIKNFQNQYPNEKIIYEKEASNLGVSKGRNRGWELAKGKYVLFLDDDAVIEKMECSIGKVLEIFSEYNEVSIIALSVYDPEYDLKLLPRIYNDKYDHALFFIGAGHIISKERLPLKKLYPESLTYGHEDMLLSLRNYQLKKSIYYESRIEIYHYPSLVRANFVSEKKNGIVNKYVVKKLLFPVLFWPILYWGFLRRNIKFWKWNTKEIFGCMILAYKRLRYIEKEENYKKFSMQQAFQLLNEFGRDFLWEISHNNSDKKLIKNKEV